MFFVLIFNKFVQRDQMEWNLGGGGKKLLILFQIRIFVHFRVIKYLIPAFHLCFISSLFVGKKKAVLKVYDEGAGNHSNSCTVRTRSNKTFPFCNIDLLG